MNDRFCHLKTAISALIATLLLASCATTPPVEEKVDTDLLVWPKPPEQAVIRWIGEFAVIDEPEEERSRFIDMVAGEEPKKLIKVLNKPFGVHTDSAGRLFVTDTAFGELFVFHQDSDEVETWGTYGQGDLNKPMGVWVDRQDRVYVTDSVDRRVVIFDSSGRYLSSFGGQEVFRNPVAIAVNDDLGRIYVLDSQLHQLKAFDMQGKELFSVGEKGPGPEQFMYPSFLTLAPDGRLFISDSMKFRIKIYDADGGVIKTFGQIGQNFGDLNRPKGVALDSDGHVYVVDTSFSNFQIFNEEGELFLFVGQGGTRPGELMLPMGIHIDNKDRIYVVDQANHRVQVFEYLGEPDITDDLPENAENIGNNN
jgi:DNA-binding beta-propeller fold protein YncE